MNIFDTLRNAFYWISGGERQRFLSREGRWQADPLLAKIYREIETEVESLGADDGVQKSRLFGDLSKFLAIERGWRTGSISRTEIESLLLHDDKFRAWYVGRYCGRGKGQTQ